MGFRNPVTSATALDTRAGHPKGVQISSQDALATWWAGLGVSAQITLSQLLSGGGGGSGTDFVLSGSGSMSGKIPAKLDLRELQAADGSWQTIAQLTADVIALNANVRVGDDWLAVANGSAAWTPLSAAYTPMVRKVGGLAQLEGIQVLAAGQSFGPGASSVCAVLPAGIVPARNVAREIILLNPNGTYGAAAWMAIPAGSQNVSVVNTTTSTLTAGYGWSIGCTFSL